MDHERIDFLACPEFRDLSSEEEFTVNELAKLLSPGSIIFSLSGNKIKYQNARAIQYARDYCAKEDNACGKFLYDPDKKLSDCAHFIAHCLDKGGITIKEPDATKQFCGNGLAVTVSALIAGLRTLSTKYDNVKEIDFSDAIVGDIGFQNTLIRPTHAFMICSPAADKDDFKIFGHTKARCCEKGQPGWFQYFATAFRLTDE